MQALSANTIKNAIKIVDAGLVQNLDDTTWLVQGSRGTVYEVSYDKAKDVYFCKPQDGNKGSICLGWKYHHNCKHCEAVREYQKRNE